MLWGSLYVVSQFVLGKIPTFTVAMFRYLIAFIDVYKRQVLAEICSPAAGRATEQIWCAG